MLSYRAINDVLSPSHNRARAVPLLALTSAQDRNSARGNDNPFGSGLDVCGVTPWAMSFGWPGHDDSSSNSQTLEQPKQPPDQSQEPSSVRRAAIGTGIAALILTVGILNQQIILAAISALERIGRSAEIQGALAKPLGKLLASTFQ